MASHAVAAVTRSTAVHDPAVDIKAVIAFLAENLGHRLLALTVGVDHRTVGRWLTEPARSPRSFETETRLRAAYQVFRTVEQVEASATVRAWFMGMNPQLNDKSPAEAIRDNESRSAMAAARAFISAGG